jgi:hypothetical protein
MPDSAGAVFDAGSIILARFVALISPSETLTSPGYVVPDRPIGG